MSRQGAAAAPPRVVITGGGTGGHLFPGIALVEGLRQRFPGCEVLFIGTHRAVDQQALRGRDFQRAVLRCRGLKGKGAAARAAGLAMLPGAMLRARKMLRDFRPALAFGVGGYVTGPVLAAARSLGVPVCIHEQNTVPGLANRMLAPLADRIFLSLPLRRPGYWWKGRKTLLLGNPVRQEILAAARGAGTPRSGPPCLLVLGGSLGARPLNRIMRQAAPRLAQALGQEWRLVHQAGAADVEELRRCYAQAGIQARVEAFITDMAQAYQEADLVLSRAGATTLAELAVMGLPALLVPYPHAADDHQRHNARWYARTGGAMILEQDRLAPELLADKAATLLQDQERRAAMAAAMRTRAMPGAAADITAVCARLILGQEDGEGL